MQPSPNKRAPFNYKFLLETTAWEGKQVGREEGIWLRGMRKREGGGRGWMGKRKEEENRDHNTSEMSPMCLAVAVVSQGTALSQEEAMCHVRGNSVNINLFFFAQM